MLLFILAIFILLFLRVPVFVALLLPCLGYFLLSPDLINMLIVQRLIGGIESVSLLAVPFFILAGAMMNHTGITSRLMSFCDLLVRKQKGGLAKVNILLSTMMGGISGSSLADASMQAKMLIPQMEEKGYTRSYSAVITAFSSVITPIIPPGIALILYGISANVSIGKLFLAGIIPGTLMCFSFIFLSDFICKKNKNLVPSEKSVSFKEFKKTLGSVLFAITIPIFIIAGIRLGIFSPTEVGAVTAIISFLVGSLVYQELKTRIVFNILLDSALISANVMLIIASASVFAWILTWEGVTQSFASFVLQYMENKYLFLFILNIMLLGTGMVIEGNALLIVLVPILMPIVKQIGIDPVHFGIIFIVNLAIGSLTPPVGTVTLTVCNICNLRIKSFIKDAIPFFILAFIILMVITYIPFISTFLPNLLY